MHYVWSVQQRVPIVGRGDRLDWIGLDVVSVIALCCVCVFVCVFHPLSPSFPPSLPPSHAATPHTQCTFTSSPSSRSLIHIHPPILTYTPTHTYTHTHTHCILKVFSRPPSHATTPYTQAHSQVLQAHARIHLHADTHISYTHTLACTCTHIILFLSSSLTCCTLHSGTYIHVDRLWDFHL